MVKTPQSIFEDKGIQEYLVKRNLLSQYKRAKIDILAGIMSGVDFKLRKPKTTGIRSFRINKQYRALGRFTESGYLLVFKIDNHQ